ncbi:hypothetical protein HBNXHx_1407 [Haloferax volcanii]|nr:hypothetical protein HBNXHx_1407 [Haloferax alexandrinus]
MILDGQSASSRRTPRRAGTVRSSNQKEYYRLTVSSYYPMTPGERKRHASAFLGVDDIEPRYLYV